MNAGPNSKAFRFSDGGTATRGRIIVIAEKFRKTFTRMTIAKKLRKAFNPKARSTLRTINDVVNEIARTNAEFTRSRISVTGASTMRS